MHVFLQDVPGSIQFVSKRKLDFWQSYQIKYTILWEKVYKDLYRQLITQKTQNSAVFGESFKLI